MIVGRRVDAVVDILHTIVGVGNGKYNRSVAHTVLIEELSVEVEHHAVALMIRAVGLNLKRHTVCRHIWRQYKGRRQLPHVGSICVVGHVGKSGLSASFYSLAVESVAYLVVHLLQLASVACIIHHRRVEVGFRHSVAMQDIDAIGSHSYRVGRAIVGLHNTFSKVIVVQDVGHFVGLQIASGDSRLAS